MSKVQPVVTRYKNTIRKENIQGNGTLRTKEEQAMIQNTQKKRHLPRNVEDAVYTVCIINIRRWKKDEIVSSAV